MFVRILALMIVAALAACAFAGEQIAAQTAGDGLKIRGEHPRIWLDDAKVKWVRDKMAGKSPGEIKALCGTSIVGKSLAYVITGDKEIGREAIDRTIAIGMPQPSDMERIAVCYDWCYPLLAPGEKNTLTMWMTEYAKKSIANERSWRSFHNGMYTEGWRVGAVALALYGDDPFGQKALDFLMPQWEDALEVFEKVFPDGAWGEGYNYNHHVANEALRFFEALRTASGVDKIAASAHLRNNGFYMMYGAKPNGLVYPGMDDDFPYLNWFEHEALIIEAAKYRDGFHQFFADHCPVKRFAFEEDLGWKTVLWHDPSVEEKPIEQLPLSRIFRDEGLVFMRSGWNWDSAARRSGDSWLAFRCGPYMGDHAHYDNNTFEIYYKGELAIDSGRYDDDWGMEQDPKTIVKSEFFNYYQRTIAHNTMLVYDPAEEMSLGVVNDGGQLELMRVNGIRNVPEDYDQGDYPADKGRGVNDWATNPGRWDVGKITGYIGTKDFTYICGDATKSYSPNKLRSFVRQFAFFQPDLVVIFDRVESTKAEFKKTWLLHSVSEPNIAGDNSFFDLSYCDGRLRCLALLPVERTLIKIGGPGNECLVAGIPYKFGLQSQGEASELHYGELPGAWRIEESPAKPATEDYFLNVLLMTDKDSDEAPQVKLADSQQAAGLSIVTKDGKAIMLSFAKGRYPAATLKLQVGGKTVFNGLLPQRVILEEGRPKQP